MKREMDFTRGPIVRSLLSFSLPILLSLFLQALYGAVDLAVVGRFAAAEDVSGVANGSQLTMALAQFIGSLSSGITILLGQRLGAGKRDECGKAAGTGIALFLCLGALMTVLVPLLSGLVARLLNVPPEAFPKTRNYIAICGLGSVMIVSYNILGSIMRGIGDSVTPLLTVLIASLFNMAGDYVLIARLHMGAEGAAIATVAAQAFSVIISVWILYRRGLPFPFSLRDIRLDRPTLHRITRFGGPVGAQDMMVGLSFLIILIIVNGLGLIPSAGVGVAEKVCAFIMLIPSAFAQAMSAFTAQNYGARKFDRAVQGLWLAVGVSLLFGTVMFWASFFHGDVLCSLFSRDGAIVEAGADYLKAYGIDCLLTCFMFCFVGFYTGLGHTGFVMLQGVAVAFLVRIPVAFFMSLHTRRLFYIGLGIPSATVVQIAACFAFYFYVKKHTLDPGAPGPEERSEQA